MQRAQFTERDPMYYYPQLQKAFTDSMDCDSPMKLQRVCSTSDPAPSIFHQYVVDVMMLNVDGFKHMLQKPSMPIYTIQNLPPPRRRAMSAPTLPSFQEILPDGSSSPHSIEPSYASVLQGQSYVSEADLLLSLGEERITPPSPMEVIFNNKREIVSDSEQGRKRAKRQPPPKTVFQQPEKKKEVRNKNSCSYHKSKHQRCPVDCIFRRPEQMKQSSCNQPMESKANMEWWSYA